MCIVLGVSASACVKASAPVIETVPDSTVFTGASEKWPSSPVVASASSSARSPGTGSSGSDTSAVGGPVRRGKLEANAVVVHEIDGDTLDVTFLDTKKRERIRLIGIDTPESKRPNTPIECFAKQASAAIASLLPLNTPVRVEHDVELRDKYERYLGYVFRAQDGLFVNLEMARVGMAVPLTFPPNVLYVDQFLAAGAAAQQAGIGLWSSCEGPHVTLTPTTNTPTTNAPTTANVGT